MKRTLILFLIVVFCTRITGQTSYTWYFGDQAGMKFHSDGTTSPQTGSYMNTSEGCTIVSDTSGVIMFYSDGMNVWNNSSSTPVSTDLLGGQSSTQAALALPVPGSNCQIFLVFTTKGIEQSGAHDLGVVLVSVTGSTPNYSVSVSEPPLSVLQPAGSVIFAEKLAAVSDTSGGYWVLAHDYYPGSGNANTFYEYHITAAAFSGVTTTAQAQSVLSAIQQTQSVGSSHSDPAPPDFNGQGQMKFSKNGQKLGLVLAGSKTINIFNFNLTTGAIMLVASTNVNPSLGNLYGCEFSPNGNVFYTSEGFASSGATIRKIYQWDISSGTLMNPYIVASGSNAFANKYKYNAMQLGPNDKIYVCEEIAVSNLSVINNPNNLGAACGWNSMTVPIANTHELGLPTVMVSFGCECLPPPGVISGTTPVCIGQTGVVYSINPVSGATGYYWSMPPGAIITSGNNSNAITVTFTGSATSGSITVNAYNASCNSVFSAPFAVTVNTPPSPTLSGLTQVCLNSGNYTYTTQPGMNAYTWNLSSGGTVISGTGTNQLTVNWINAGIQWVSVNYTSSNGCSSQIPGTLNVQVDPLPDPAGYVNGPISLCAGSTNVVYSVAAIPNAVTYTWLIPTGTTIVSGNGTNQITMDFNPGAVSGNIRVFGINPCGNGDTSFLAVVVHDVVVPVISGNDTICQHVPAIITTQNGMSTYQWTVSPGGTMISGGTATDNNVTVSWYVTGIAWVKVDFTDNNGCTVSLPVQKDIWVRPEIAAGISVTASKDSVCSGTQVTFTASPVHPGTSPFYQWYLNSNPAGTNSDTYTFIPLNGDLVSCTLTSNASCVINNPASSLPYRVTVNPLQPVSVTISASSNPICAGSPVTFTAHPINGGITPSYEWKVNGISMGSNSNTYTCNPNNGDSVRCILTSDLNCTMNNPVSSNKILMSGIPLPLVSFTSCFDTITTVNAKPIKLKGGIPLGGTYSGPGVNSITGVFTPALAGAGTKMITYSYTNSMLCSASKSLIIHVSSFIIHNCGDPFTDPRDNKVYQTVQIGSQCWLASNLNFGTILASSQDQRDNCIAEKYCYNDNPVNCTNHGGLYQWDELMRFDETPASQGYCPPGWHIPSENDWNLLFAVYINNGFAGSPLKYSGYSGFNALLSGARYINRSWDFKGFATFFWSSTALGSTKAWAHGMNEADPSVSLYPASRVNAFSVRCLKD
jgi:uncharacterized protein (TIGR02145 family)